MNRDCLWLIARSLELVDLLAWRLVDQRSAAWIVDYLSYRGCWSWHVDGLLLRKLRTNSFRDEHIPRYLQLTHLKMITWICDQELPFWTEGYQMPSQITQLTNLTSLDLSTSSVEAWIYSMTNLRKLVIRPPIKDQEERVSLPLIAPLTQLRSLQLFKIKLQDSDIVTLTNLRKLNLKETKGVTGTCFTALTQLTSLTMSKHFTSRYGSLYPLSQLVTLDLDRTIIRDSEIATIATFLSLRSLSLNYCRAITSLGLSVLTNLTELEVRHVTGIRADHLRTLDTLESLAIKLSALNNASLTQLTRLNHLDVNVKPGINRNLHLLTSLHCLHLYYPEPVDPTTYSLVDLSQVRVNTLDTNYPVTDLSCLPLGLRELGCPASPFLLSQLSSLNIKFFA